MNNITDIKLNTTAAARIAQNEIAAKAIALFGAEAVTAGIEIKRKASDIDPNFIYAASAYLTVTVDLRKTDLAKRWIAAANTGLAKGIAADSPSIGFRKDISEWDRKSLSLQRLTNPDFNYEPVHIWAICIEAEVYPKQIRPVPYENRFRESVVVDGQLVYRDIDRAAVAAITRQRTASIDDIVAYRVTGSLNGRRYDSDSRAFKVGTFIDAGAEAANEAFTKFERTVTSIEGWVAEFDLAAYNARVTKAEAEYAARKARADFINGQIEQINARTGAESRYDSRQIAEYSAEGLSAGRLDVRTSKLTEAEVDAILAVLNAASVRIAAEKAASTVSA